MAHQTDTRESTNPDRPGADPIHSPVGFGIAIFSVTAPIHLLTDTETSISIAAITLALIGGAYIGFAVADGRPRVFWPELAVATLFGAAAVLGILWHWAALPLGLTLHAGWDLMHHNSHRLARIPKWYVPFCVVYDLLAAGFLVLLYGVFG